MDRSSYGSHTADRDLGLVAPPRIDRTICDLLVSTLPDSQGLVEVACNAIPAIEIIEHCRTYSTLSSAE